MTMPYDLVKARWTVVDMPVPFVDTLNTQPDLNDLPDLWGSALVQVEVRRDVTMGAQPWVEESGNIVVGLFARAGTGPNALDVAVQALRDGFAGYVKDEGEGTFQVSAVDGPVDIDPETDGDWWRVAMSMPYTYQSRRLVLVPDPITYVRWSTTFKNASTSLSLDELTAYTEAISEPPHCAVRSEFGIQPGQKRYFEVEGIGTWGGANAFAAGLCNVDFVFNTWIGMNDDAIALWGTTVYRNSISELNTGNPSPQRIGWAVDGGNKAWVRMDGVWFGNPETETGGFDISTLGVIYPTCQVRGLMQARGRFSADDLIDALPAGYGVIS